MEEEKKKPTKVKIKLSPQLVKHGTIIAPALVPCKLEMSSVVAPQAIKQRNIQLHAIETISPNHGLRHRKKTVVDGTVYPPSGESTSTSDDDETKPFETHLVIEFSPNINRSTLHWIIDKLRKKKLQGGAELLVRREPQQSPNRGLVIHISAEDHKFLQVADELEIMKPTRSGVMRNFNISCLEEFFIDEKMAIKNVLTMADRQIIMKHIVDSIKATEFEKHIPGYEILTLYHGQSIIAACSEVGLIETMYSLRETEFLEKLKRVWYKKWFGWQPLDRIREYFGESVGIYFAFVEYHTLALIVPAILGIFQYFLHGRYVPYFCAFYVVWMLMFLEIWKLRCSSIAYRWGTITMTNLDIPRIGYYGKISKDPITGRKQPQYEMWKTYAWMYGVSLPTIVICLLPAAFFALSQFWLEEKILSAVGTGSLLVYLPSIVESIIVTIFSSQYEKLATWLTDLENHRTQAQYERHRVIKLIALEFVNNFLSLFYIAFWLGDVRSISNQLMTQLIVFQIVQKLLGTLWPTIRPKLIVWKENYLNNYTLVAKNEYDYLNLLQLPSDDPRIEQNKHESTLLEYNSTYEDYLEMYIQFGYVVLFASISPFASIFAFVNNIIELKIDAYKLCCVYRRPFARRAKNTGAWHLAFETLVVMSIITNCGLLYLQPEVRSIADKATREETLLSFVIVEHVLLGIAWAMNKAIPDRPHSVRVALAKADFESRQAVKRENHKNEIRSFKKTKKKEDKPADSAQTTRNILLRRFYSQHGRRQTLD